MIWDALHDLDDVDVRDYRVPGYRRKRIYPRGVLEHHTASPQGSGDLPSLHVCQRGRPDLPGPLCQVLIGRAGTVAVVTDGYANHAGTGAWPGITNGNEQLIGVEIENDGRGEPWTPGVIRVASVVTARLCERFGLPVELVIGHKEWARGRKIDPTFDMGGFRKLVQDRLAAPLPVPVPSTGRKKMFQFGDGTGAVYLWDGEKVIPLGGLPTVHGQLNASGIAPFIGHLPAGEANELRSRLSAAG